MIRTCLLGLLVLSTLWSVAVQSSSPDGGTVTEAASASPTTADDHGHHKKPERYSVVSLDFTRVETPFMIGLWIFFSSLAKIGNSIDF